MSTTSVTILFTSIVDVVCVLVLVVPLDVVVVVTVELLDVVIVFSFSATLAILFTTVRCLGTCGFARGDDFFRVR